MIEAKTGDTVQVHYTGKLQDGTVFDTSEERDPLQFKLGEGKIIPGFENAIVGMKKGESKSFNIRPENGYGEYNDELIFEVERNRLPDDVSPEVGMYLESVQDDGRRVPVKITDIEEEKIKLDANHPLAGHELIFEVKLVDVIKDA